MLDCMPYHQGTYIPNTGLSREFPRPQGMYAMRLQYRDIGCPDPHRPKLHAPRPARASVRQVFWQRFHPCGLSDPNFRLLQQLSGMHPSHGLNYWNFAQRPMHKLHCPNPYRRSGIQCLNSPVLHNPTPALRKSLEWKPFLRHESPISGLRSLTDPWRLLPSHPIGQSHQIFRSAWPRAFCCRRRCWRPSALL